MSFPSVQAGPKKEIPTGRPKMYPAGTVMSGYPATAAGPEKSAQLYQKVYGEMGKMLPRPELLALLNVCPARCYELSDKGQVEITVDGCIECGTCRVIGEPSGDIEWSYPRGGYGVLFKFG